MQGTVGRVTLGFVAAAIAVVTAHEGIIFLLNTAGIIPGRGWSMTSAIPPWGVPRLINNIFWGGLWGALFALVYDRLPGHTAWLKGLVYGILIAIFSNWILLPFIKGWIFGQANQVMFAGWSPQRMLITLVIVGGFGLALGLIYDAMRPRNGD